MYKDVLEGVYPKMWHRAARRWLLVTSGVRHVDLAPGRELLTTVIEMHHLVSHTLVEYVIKLSYGLIQINSRIRMLIST
jgi:hypothetical protein